MVAKRQIEVFSAGCAVCEDTIARIREFACSNCEVVALDMREADVVARAKTLGVRSVPAVAVDDRLAACCGDRGIDMDRLRELGLGQPLP